jgi:hypothetical protein
MKTMCFIVAPNSPVNTDARGRAVLYELSARAPVTGNVRRRHVRAPLSHAL